MNHLELEVHPTDDLVLLAQVTNLITGMAQTNAYEHYAVFRIKNWFDDKWVGFTGVFNNYHQNFGPDTYDKHRMARVLPPFARSRVEAVSMIGEPTRNLAAIFFFSTNNLANRRASLLGSIPSEDGTHTWEWYIGYKQSETWRAIRHKNISAGEASSYVEFGA